MHPNPLFNNDNYINTCLFNNIKQNKDMLATQADSNTYSRHNNFRQSKCDVITELLQSFINFRYYMSQRIYGLTTQEQSNYIYTALFISIVKSIILFIYQKQLISTTSVVLTHLTLLVHILGRIQFMYDRTLLPPIPLNLIDLCHNHLSSKQSSGFMHNVYQNTINFVCV